MAAQFATPEAINFMAKEARGHDLPGADPERCDELGLDLMAAKNESPFETAFTVSIEAREGVTTGISAARPRPHDPGGHRPATPGPHDLVAARATSSRSRPRRAACSSAPARPRPASTSRGWPALIPAGVICEVMNDDGTMARVPDLVPYCERHELKMITVADLIAYRRRNDKLVERVVETALPTAFGEFTAVGLPLAGRRQAPRRDGQGRRGGPGRTCSCACTPSA